MFRRLAYRLLQNTYCTIKNYPLVTHKIRNGYLQDIVTLENLIYLICCTLCFLQSLRQGWFYFTDYFIINSNNIYCLGVKPCSNEYT